MIFVPSVTKLESMARIKKKKKKKKHGAEFFTRFMDIS
jgi:hypothetical protein